MSDSKHLFEEFEISSSWILEDDSKEIKNTITLECSNKSVELEDVVQVNTCIHFVQENANNNEPCTVSVALSDSAPHLISQLVIVSEARIVELFGKCEEYLTTCTAEYVDDFEDCAVYMARCTFKPTRQLSIKFQRTKHTNNLWLYGIHVQLLPIEPSNFQALSSIDYRTVNDLLQESKVPISDSAERLKTFLQNYGAGALNQNQQPYRSKPPDLEMLMKMLQEESYSSVSKGGKSMSKCFQNMFPAFVRDSLPKNKKVPECCDAESVGHTSELSELKCYIDQRFTEIEKRISGFERQLVEIEKRQHSKLDCIIALLSSK